MVEELKKERRNARAGGWLCLGCQMGLPWELVSGFCKKEARRAASSTGVGMWRIVATGVCWARRSCAGPCDGAPENGSCEGECSLGAVLFCRFLVGFAHAGCYFNPPPPMPTPAVPGQMTIWFLRFLTVEFAPVIPPLEALIFLESSFLRLSSFFFLWPHPPPSDLTQHLCLLLRLLLSGGEERMCLPSICSPPLWDEQEQVGWELE